MSWRLLTATVSRLVIPSGWFTYSRAHMRPVPPGVAGDLYLFRYPALAQGCLGRPDLTASRFIAVLFAPGTDVPYRRCGALAGFRRGEATGRSDDQLKNSGGNVLNWARLTASCKPLPDVEQAVAHACVFNQAAATGGDARQLVGFIWCRTPVCRWIYRRCRKNYAKTSRAYGAGCVVAACQLARQR